MAKLINFGQYGVPTTGSPDLLERVKYFESVISLEDLQAQINLWIVFISGPIILNRPAIRDISYSNYVEPQPPTIVHVAQIHYILIGDADDEPNI